MRYHAGEYNLLLFLTFKTGLVALNLTAEYLSSCRMNILTVQNEDIRRTHAFLNPPLCVYVMPVLHTRACAQSECSHYSDNTGPCPQSTTCHLLARLKV